MLGVLFLQTFTRLGHEFQDLLSPCDGMRMCTHWTSVYTLMRKDLLGNGVRTDVNSKGKKSPQWEDPEKGRASEAASRGIASPTHYRLSYSDPRPVTPKPVF